MPFADYGAGDFLGPSTNILTSKASYISPPRRGAARHFASFAGLEEDARHHAHFARITFRAALIIDRRCRFTSFFLLL